MFNPPTVQTLHFISRLNSAAFMEWKWPMRTAAETIEADNCITSHYFSASCQHIKHSNTHTHTHTETKRQASALKQLRQRAGQGKSDTVKEVRRTDAEDRGEAALQYSTILKITYYASLGPQPTALTAAPPYCQFAKPKTSCCVGGSVREPVKRKTPGRAVQHSTL